MDGSAATLLSKALAISRAADEGVKQELMGNPEECRRLVAEIERGLAMVGDAQRKEASIVIDGFSPAMVRSHLTARLGFVKFAMNEDDEGVKLYQEAAAIQEGLPGRERLASETHATLAGFLNVLDRLDPATSHAKRALELDPTNVQAQKLLVDIEAARKAGTAQRNEPKTRGKPEAIDKLKVALSYQDEADKREKQFEDDESAANRAIKDLTRGLKLVDEAEKIDADAAFDGCQSFLARSMILETMARIQSFYLHDYPTAIETQKKAIEVWTGRGKLEKMAARLHRNLALMYKVVEDYAQARTHFHKSLELNPDETEVHKLLDRFESEIKEQGLDKKKFRGSWKGLGCLTTLFALCAYAASLGKDLQTIGVAALLGLLAVGYWRLKTKALV